MKERKKGGRGEARQHGKGSLCIKGCCGPKGKGVAGINEQTGSKGLVLDAVLPFGFGSVKCKKRKRVEN